jgi:cyclic-di-GMP-binding protein
MAFQHSFDIVSQVDMQEVMNAYNQSMKEVQTRYDFKGSKSTIDLLMKEKELVVHADDDFKRKALIDILQTKLIKRGVPIKALQYGKIEDAAEGMLRQTITLQSGIDKDKARMLVKMIKDLKLKTQATIQEDQVRVVAMKIDDLQTVIGALREADLEFDIQFVNYR